MNDLKFALRQCRKSPGFTLVAVLTLAIGIGANTAIFSVVEGALLRPLPFPHAERLVRIYEALEQNGARSASLNLSDRTAARFREFGGDVFGDVAGGTGGVAVVGLSPGSPARTVPAAQVTWNFFDVLGLPPAQGRNFTAQEARGGADNVAIISDDFWRNTLNSRHDVLGSTLVVDGTPRTIIGVMPKAFRHPYRANLWLPLALESDNPATINNHYLYGVARLRSGFTPAKAEAAVKRMCATMNRDDPNPANARGAYITPLRESFVMDLRPKILVIVGAAICALLIAAVNFAGLLLARIIDRQGEFALRAALGASRKRLVRQQLIQALFLALVGTALGLLIASWITPVLFTLSPEGTDATGSAMREFDYAARIDLPVFAFAAGVMALVGLGFGLLPAACASRTDLRGAISVTSRGATLNRNARRMLGSFVVIELAVAAALLTASVTATQYFRKLIDEPWGFETKNRLAFNVTVPDQFFATPAAKQKALEDSLAQLQALPGIKSTTVVSPSPMNASWTLMLFNAEGAPAPEPRGVYTAYSRVPVPGYFQSIGQPILQGRDFNASDTADAALVCIVSQSIAKRFWPNESPIGKRIRWGRLDGSRPWFTIIGVVGDMKAIADPRDGEVLGMIARPLAQMLVYATTQLDDITFVLHTNGRSINESTIRAAITRANANLAAYNFLSLEDAAASSRTTERFIFILVSSFGFVGLVLSAVGLYGLLALQVARREREFGIRSALGATARQIVRLVARQGATLLALGFTAGALATFGVVRVLRNQWFDMPAPNVIACICAGIVLGIAAMIACWLPARRAARVDPIIALRAE
ncbi:MAG TPA: ABC transporter permease [Candidatus Udaeobacter sp.]|nr:ABC transporter permease [Candidatus Udaeobacter sp.]